jgi:hypothetical protein
MDRYFWNASAGLYFDYDFENGRQSTYAFVTTYYPLWVGAASAEQAKAVAGRFHTFAEPGGLVTSRETTEAQWDYPYGWAPDELIGADGLRRYGYSREAGEVASQFVSMVAGNFRHDGTIKEKYNVVTRLGGERHRRLQGESGGLWMDQRGYFWCCSTNSAARRDAGAQPPFGVLATIKARFTIGSSTAVPEMDENSPRNLRPVPCRSTFPEPANDRLGPHATACTTAAPPVFVFAGRQYPRPGAPSASTPSAPAAVAGRATPSSPVSPAVIRWPATVS